MFIQLGESTRFQSLKLIGSVVTAVSNVVALVGAGVAGTVVLLRLASLVSACSDRFIGGARSVGSISEVTSYRYFINLSTRVRAFSLRCGSRRIPRSNAELIARCRAAHERVA